MITAIAFICMFLTGLLSGVILTVAFAVYKDPEWNRETIREAIRDDKPIEPNPILIPKQR